VALPYPNGFYYVNETAKVSAKMNRSWNETAQSVHTGRCSAKDEHRLLNGFNGSNESLHEPSIKQTLHAAMPYIHHSFEGEAVLSVGKAIDYINKGVSGILNVMPFTCMPGTIASAILKTGARRP